METTHFKAPWKLCYDGQIDSADGRTVARFQWESYREFTELSGDEQKTLRLIAAAPDLLAALQACLKLIQAEVADGTYTTEAIEAREAIDKATGVI